MHERSKEMVDSGDFASISDFVSTALTDFLARLDEKKMSEEDRSKLKFRELLEAFSRTDEGYEILESLYKYGKKE